MPHIKNFTGKRAHMIGIGGSSMSGLAGMLKTFGVVITGSDSVRSYMTEKLENDGITVHIGTGSGAWRTTASNFSVYF